jgi:predicted neutral ceramidase superfamily lipid hydrolase
MRSDKTQVIQILRNASKKSVLISATPIILLLALFIFLGFHGVASSDDYADYALVQKMGFWGAIQETYLHWGGRFTSYVIVFLLNPLTLNLVISLMIDGSVGTINFSFVIYIVYI